MFLKRRKQINPKYFRADQLSGPRRRQVFNYYQQSDGPKSHSKLILTLILIGVVLVGQSIFQIPIFALNNLEIRELADIPADQIKSVVEENLGQRRWLIFQNKNFFLFRAGTLPQQLAERFNLKNIVIKKIFPQTLIVEGQEKIIPFVRQTPENFIQLNYLGQETGFLGSVNKGTIIIADERTDRSQPIALDYLEKATNIVRAWKFSEQQLAIVKFHLTNNSDELTVSTNRGYRLLFSATEDPSVQLARLKELLDQNIIPDNISYVDLKFGDHVYFK